MDQSAASLLIQAGERADHKGDCVVVPWPPSWPVLFLQLSPTLSSYLQSLCGLHTCLLLLCLSPAFSGASQSSGACFVTCVVATVVHLFLYHKDAAFISSACTADPGEQAVSRHGFHPPGSPACLSPGPCFQFVCSGGNRICSASSTTQPTSHFFHRVFSAFLY